MPATATAAKLQYTIASLSNPSVFFHNIDNNAVRTLDAGFLKSLQTQLSRIMEASGRGPGGAPRPQESSVQADGGGGGDDEDIEDEGQRESKRERLDPKQQQVIAQAEVRLQVTSQAYLHGVFSKGTHPFAVAVNEFCTHLGMFLGQGAQLAAAPSSASSADTPSASASAAASASGSAPATATAAAAAGSSVAKEPFRLLSSVHSRVLVVRSFIEALIARITDAWTANKVILYASYIVTPLVREAVSRRVLSLAAPHIREWYCQLCAPQDRFIAQKMKRILEDGTLAGLRAFRLPACFPAYLIFRCAPAACLRACSGWSPLPASFRGMAFTDLHQSTAGSSAGSAAAAAPAGARAVCNFPHEVCPGMRNES